MNKLRVLVACEFSGVVREAFKAKGHDAWSCDLLPTEIPGQHLLGDVTPVLNLGWDMMIAFPPCTNLAVSGARHFKEKIKDGRQQDSIDFFMLMVNAPIPKICIENPVGIMSRIYRKPDQIIQPYRFGEPFQKTTCLWLKGLKKLLPTHHEAPLFGEYLDKGEFVRFKSGKVMSKWMANSFGDGHKRSKTFQNIANAMADQWG